MEVDRRQWLRPAERRLAEHRDDTFAVYQTIAEEVLQKADRCAYHDGVRILNKATAAAHPAASPHVLSKRVGLLREQCRRRLTLIAMLDNAGLVRASQRPMQWSGVSSSLTQRASSIWT